MATEDETSNTDRLTSLLAYAIDVAVEMIRACDGVRRVIPLVGRKGGRG